MTPEEATKLRLGDRVLMYIVHDAQAWVAHEVLETPRDDGYGVVSGYMVSVLVRRCGVTVLGHRYPSKGVWNRFLKPCPDIVDGNVYADWLRDHGFTEAAEALAKAFPLRMAK